ncbi:hypothetical protein GCM10020295_81920 [Streptomyces cinereospinus]
MSQNLADKSDAKEEITGGVNQACSTVHSERTPGGHFDWHSIGWAGTEENVRRLRHRIFQSGGTGGGPQENPQSAKFHAKLNAIAAKMTRPPKQQTPAARAAARGLAG